MQPTSCPAAATDLICGKDVRNICFQTVLVIARALSSVSTRNERLGINPSDSLCRACFMLIASRASTTKSCPQIAFVSTPRCNIARQGGTNMLGHTVYCIIRAHSSARVGSHYEQKKAALVRRLLASTMELLLLAARLFSLSAPGRVLSPELCYRRIGHRPPASRRGIGLTAASFRIYLRKTRPRVRHAPRVIDVLEFQERKNKA